ncbi:MAG TPA: hypothetical protein PK867_05205 [Pirellulales bacterium]|nr:hypothetical protein [Pirellulales bacterium]
MRGNGVNALRRQGRAFLFFPLGVFLEDLSCLVATGVQTFDPRGVESVGGPATANVSFSAA